jgi:hypothetical protein
MISRDKVAGGGRWKLVQTRSNTSPAFSHWKIEISIQQGFRWRKQEIRQEQRSALPGEQIG